MRIQPEVEASGGGRTGPSFRGLPRIVDYSITLLTLRAKVHNLTDDLVVGSVHHVFCSSKIPEKTLSSLRSTCGPSVLNCNIAAPTEISNYGDFSSKQKPKHSIFSNSLKIFSDHSI